MYTVALIIGVIAIIMFSATFMGALINGLPNNSESESDYAGKLDEYAFEKYIRHKASNKYLLIVAVIVVCGIVVSLRFFDGGYALLGVAILIIGGTLFNARSDGIGSSAGERTVQARRDEAEAQERALVAKERRLEIERREKIDAVEKKREATEALMEAEKSLQKQRDESTEVAKQQQSDFRSLRIKQVENFFFEFFNNSQFAIEFIDEPDKKNKGFPEIGWKFNSLSGQNGLVLAERKNSFTSFLKRQEFSIHVMRNRGTMHRNPRDVIASDAIEIYTHRKMDDYRFVDKEADMNVTMNYYVYISLRVDNIDMDSEQPVARLEEYDWSIRPLKSDDRHHAYFEFDTHRVTREEFVGEVARKQRELNDRKAMSRLKEMEQELDDEQGGVRNRLERVAQKFKNGGMQQKRAVDKEIGQIVDEEIASGMSEEDAEALFETLRNAVEL